VTDLVCCCGDVHELSAGLRAAYANITAGLPPTIVVKTPGGTYRVPRIYLAAHDVKSGDVPFLAARYGWETAA
jgi:hypothetical protein